ncbi:MAG: tRNA preQ1(34) S-adenosylmethionine ribosyltransferase-isomerase QueA [Candidatus Omnitrophica bacterium]|nr:tRNA preQ1(34) S-adenosylmethionine ribosyltransferase-isomerase QueA [Candidatus Omnitrophota bacterium]
MNLSDFDYSLPEELIAQYPCAARDEARLLVVDRASGDIWHDTFRYVGKYLPSQSFIVVNNSRVIHARLLGEKARSGGKVEVFLLKQIDALHFEAMLKPLKKIHEGDVLEFPGGVRCSLADREKRIVRFETPDILKALQKVGHIPLPPYIKRSDEASDDVNYQTVYARRDGSVAAPTAGLHFTDELMASLKAQGHSFHEVTLHVNYGTFKPVEVEDITTHPMHFEEYVVPDDVAMDLSAARKAGRKVAAVGTTSCRTLESFARSGKREGATNLFLYPGAEFKAVDTLITNFHLPKSTLLMLVSAFAGTDLIRRAYAQAIREKYRFYSYGDAMIIL